MGVSRTAWSVQVRDGDLERIITYYPRGKKLVDGQTVRLIDTPFSADRKWCALSLSGTARAWIGLPDSEASPRRSGCETSREAPRGHTLPNIFPIAPS